MEIVCVQCQVEFRAHKTGAIVVEMAGSPPEPYRLWACDIWKCPICSVQICGKFGRQPIAEHYQPGFARALMTAQENETLLYAYERIP